MHLTIRKYRKVLGDKKQLVDLVNRELAPMLAGTSGPCHVLAFNARIGKHSHGSDTSDRYAAGMFDLAEARRLLARPVSVKIDAA
jgi:hypothetical protein